MSNPATKIVANIRALLENGFLRAVGILVGGTAAAQAILALTLPIATRLYSPEDFNLLAVFTGTVSILSVAICLRLDVAVPLPEKEEDSVNLVAAASTIAVLIALTLLVPFLAFPQQIADLIRQPQLAPFLWLIPVAALLAGLYSTLQFWFVRQKRFSLIAQNRIIQAGGSSGTQIGLGLLGIVPVGLLLGQTVNSGLGAIGLAIRAARSPSFAQARISFANMRRVVGEYDRFPKYSTIEAAANSAAIYLPIMILAGIASGPEAGFLMLGMYAMQVPMSLIGTSISQVYMSRGPEELRAGTLDRFTVSVLSGLLRTGVGPLCLIGILAPNVFQIVFGEAWHRAGVLVTWMTPWFILQFLASPLSLALHVTGRLRTAFALQLFGLVLRVGTVLFAAAFATGFISELYALSGAVFYAIYLWLILRATGAGGTDVRRVFLKSSPIIAASIAVALVMRLVWGMVAGG